MITPVYNGARYLAQCIESVLDQTYGDFEYVVCDNHSTDGTAAIVERYAARDPRVRIVRPDHFLPQIENWNFATRQASPGSVYLKFVHADDTIAPICLERMVGAAERNPTAGMVGALRSFGGDVVDLDGIPPTFELVPGRWLLRYQLLGGRYTTGPPTATLLRTAALGDLQALYDESYIHADDTLSFHVLLESDFAYVPEVLSFTRLHEGSTTAWCDRIGTWTPEHLRMAFEFGPSVLTEEELDRAVQRREREYTMILTKALVSLKLARDGELRRFHRQALRTLDSVARKAARRLNAELRLFHRLLELGAGQTALTPTPLPR